MCEKHLLPGLTTRPPLSPMSGKEDADSHKLSPDTYAHIQHTLRHMHPHPYTCTQNKVCNKNAHFIVRNGVKIEIRLRRSS